MFYRKPKGLSLKTLQQISQTNLQNPFDYSFDLRNPCVDFPEETSFGGKMHDFCFTIPYGLILVGGGIVGYVKKGGTTSLVDGGVAGLLLILAGYLSLKAFEKRKNSYFALVLETVCAAVLTWIMGQHYLQTSKIVPAGIVAGTSALMIGFYVYKIATGGNHIPVKAE